MKTAINRRIIINSTIHSTTSIISIFWMHRLNVNWMIIRQSVSIQQTMTMTPTLNNRRHHRNAMTMNVSKIQSKTCKPWSYRTTRIMVNEARHTIHKLMQNIPCSCSLIFKGLQAEQIRRLSNSYCFYPHFITAVIFCCSRAEAKEDEEGRRKIGGGVCGGTIQIADYCSL